ncbi:MAG: carboxypeptidase regulatory-like domain-containing protein [Thermochromatium sp.]
MTCRDKTLGTWVWLALPLTMGLAQAQYAPAPPAPLGPGLRTEWAIAPADEPAPAAVELPQGTVLQEEMLLPPGTILPGGAILPPKPGTPAPAQPAPRPAPAPTPATEVTGGVPYISGGIGVSGREQMQEVKSRFNLRLLFAVAGSGAYLADVRVRIDDAAGQTLLEAVSQGPWFYANLPPGRYVLHVDYANQVQTRTIVVPATGAVEQSFYWNE